MIKNAGNISKALEELNKNDSVSHLYNEASFGSGKLNGAVFTIKDLYATKDAKTQASSKILENFNPNYDATIIKKIRNAGAAIVAKVHLDELALGGTGTFNAYSKIYNPLNKDRMIGGSSSGSAATFSKNISIAIGSDTGDSVRLPASYIGKFGFKPSYGAISRYGQFSYACSLDTVAYFGHNIEDIILTSQILYGKDSKDMSSKNVLPPVNEIIKPKTIGVIKNIDGLEEYQINAYDESIEKLKNDGIEILEFNIDKILTNAIDTVYQCISFSEASSNDSNLNGIAFGASIKGEDWSEIMINTRTKKFGIEVQKRFTLGAMFLNNKYIDKTFYKSQKVRSLIVEHFNQIKSKVDVLIFPTKIAPLLSEGKKDNWLESYLIHANLSGTPSIVIPWKKHNNMPFGLSIDGLLYKDKELLSNALYINKLVGGSNE